MQHIVEAVTAEGGGAVMGPSGAVCTAAANKGLARGSPAIHQLVCSKAIAAMGWWLGKVVRASWVHAVPRGN